MMKCCLGGFLAIAAPMFSSSLVGAALPENALPIGTSLGDQRVLQDFLEPEKDCSGDPFLWLIQRKAEYDHDGNAFAVEKSNETTGMAAANGTNADTTTEPLLETVGFAVGTMRFVPRTVAVTETAWRSLVHAAADSCGIYGETELPRQSEATRYTRGCPRIDDQTARTIVDIPDPDLRKAYRGVLLDIHEYYFPDFARVLTREHAEQLPLESVLEMVALWNTPDLRDAYFRTTFLALQPEDGHIDEKFLDQELLKLGRPSGSLESHEDSCRLFDLNEISKDDFVDKFEEDYRTNLEKALNASLIPLKEAYSCGGLGRASKVLEDETLATGARATDLMFLPNGDRNLNMAKRAIAILETSPHPPMFVLGLAHWIAGENNLEKLLAEEGYILERVEGLYDSGFLPDVPDASCSKAAGDSWPPAQASGATEYHGWGFVLCLLLLSVTLQSAISSLQS